jgi:hypothetical protein
MYNVLEKLRMGEALTAKDRQVHEQGLVSVLKQIHDELDAAVLAAYGWEDLTGFGNLSGLGASRVAADRDAQILERLVALNAERAAEEAQGLVRWLRPEYQAPDETPQPAARQAALLEVAETAEVAPPDGKQPWPDTLPARARAVRAALVNAAAPATARDLASFFRGRRTDNRLAELQAILETLAALGQATETEDGRFLAA